MVLKGAICQELRVDLLEERQVDGVAMMCGKDVLVHDLDIRENFYSRYDRGNARGTMEIDFLIVRGYDNAAMKPRISPVEVKSTKRYGTSSLDKFRASFGKRLGTEYVLHLRQLQVEGDRVYLPLYASFCL